MKTDVPDNRRTPIYRDAGFDQLDLAGAAAAFEKEDARPQSADRPIYTRYGNPTVYSAELALSSVEQAGWSVATSSGLAAVDLSLGIFHTSESKKPWLFLSELYGGTNAYIERVLRARRGVRCEVVTPEGETYPTEKIIAELKKIEPSVFFFEPLTNPLLICIDAAAVIASAKEVGARVIVDNTFATSELMRPLELGADLVVHSATKYLGGHGDLTGGVVSGNDRRLRDDALVYRKLTGCILSPDDASRLQTYLKTFKLRVRRQFDNAAALAQFLNEHAGVKRVRYPGLAGHASHDIAKKIFGNRGYGGVITFDIDGGNAACERFFARAMPRIGYVPTLGDAETIFLHVQSTFGKPYSSESVRLSVGVEPVEELEEILRDSLRQ